MHQGMIDGRNKWPLALNKTSIWPFLAVVVAIFLCLVFLDAPVSRWVADAPQWVRDPFMIITRFGKSDWMLIPALVGALGFYAFSRISKDILRQQQARLLAALSAFVLAGIGLPGLTANLLKRSIGRARPMSIEEVGIFHFVPVINGSTYQSFPSGHTTTIFALAAVIMFFWPKTAWWVLIGAALVGLSRVMVGVHFPTDVFGGILVGTFGAFAVRNYCASRGWLFVERDGQFVPDVKWPTSDSVKS